jgi:hypothetical protein
MRITIADLIRREGREPGGKPCAQIWVVKWGKNTVHKKYPPSPWRSSPMKFRISVQLP